MRKILIVLFVVALSSACNPKPTREQCLEFSAPLIAENIELRGIAAKWKDNYFKAMKLIKLMQAQEKKLLEAQKK